MSGPLTDLKVVEICGELGQYAGKLLADLGANVIKVEPPGGSSARSIGPFVRDIPGPDRSLDFWYHNTNKRSVVLDFEHDPADRRRLRRVVLACDILVEDNEPGWLARFGLDYGSLAGESPRLVYCSVTPFGQDGPWAHYRSSDMVGLALGGPMNMNGYNEEDVPGAPPIRGHGDQGYKTACHFAAMGMLAATDYRDRTGEGQHVDCSMHEALNSTTEVGLPYWLYKRQNVIRQTARHAAVQRTESWRYPAADGKDVIIFGVGRDNASWKLLKEWFQAEGFGNRFNEPRFDDPRNRQPARGSPEAAEILGEVERFFAAHPAEEIYRGGQERAQAWGVVRAPDETVADSHWHDRGFFVPVTGEGLETDALMPGAPYLLSATPWELRRPAPKLGEHTAEVLEEFGLA